MPETDQPVVRDLPPVPDAADRAMFGWMRRAVATVAALAVGLAAGAIWLWESTPDAREIVERATAQPSRIVSTDGELLDTIGTNQSLPVGLDQVAPSIIHALLATEDRRFHDHAGLDPRRIVAAVGRTLSGQVQGASTLTQQLARNLFPKRVGNQRSLLRKLREGVVALKIEQAYSKQQILALYLNNVPFLYDVVGIEMAARTYFSKPASRVEPHEAALLVAMLKGPRYYDPERRPERARARRDMVLRLMVRDGFIDEAAMAAARARPLGVQITRHDVAPPLAPHYLRVVKAEVAQWAARHGLDPLRDGLRIQVALDARLQRLAEAAVARQGDLLQQIAASEWSAPALRAGPPRKPVDREKAFAWFWQSNPELRAELQQLHGVQPATAGFPARADAERLAAAMAAKTRLEAGFVALDPRSGAVRAYVGSRSWQDDRFDHVAQARRQPGSTFKPFVYGAALASGMPQNRMFADRPFTVALADGQTWTPADVGQPSGEWMMMRTGLARSRNTVTAQVMQQVGVDQVIRYARAAGIRHSPLDAVPSLALGTSPVTLLELTGAYGTLAALGMRHDPMLIETISDRSGRLLLRFDQPAQRTLGTDHAATMVDMLREAVDSGTGTLLRSRFELKADIAGKSGTSQRNADGWFVSLQPHLVTGAWVGFNDQRVTMRSTQWGQGGRSALLLVGDFLREAGKAGLIDMAARFPAVQRPLPPLLFRASPDLLDDDFDEPPPSSSPGDLPSLPLSRPTAPQALPLLVLDESGSSRPSVSRAGTVPVDVAAVRVSVGFGR